MTLETHPAAEALQLEHSAYSKDFDANIISVLGQLEERNVLMIWLSHVNVWYLCPSAAEITPTQRHSAPAWQKLGPVCLESTPA